MAAFSEAASSVGTVRLTCIAKDEEGSVCMVATVPAFAGMTEENRARPVSRCPFPNSNRKRPKRKSDNVTTSASLLGPSVRCFEEQGNSFL
jgi:hypothetical protein